MLANINEKIWNVSNEGMGSVLQSVKVADDYQALIDKMQKVSVPQNHSTTKMQ
jgi:hypothetical protein